MTFKYAPGVTDAAVIVHVVSVPAPVREPVMVTGSPATEPVGGEPLPGYAVMPGACAVGVTTDETEMNTPDMRSNNTKNEEPTLVVVN